MRLRTIKTGSDGNCYVLLGKKSLILEAGAKLREVTKALDYDVSGIAGCLVTHKHKDHSRYIKEYIRSGIRVFGNQQTADACGSGMMAVLTDRTKCQVGEFTVTPFYVPHISMDNGEMDDCPNFAYLIQHEIIGTMLYATDFEYLPYTFRSMRLDHILIECNYMSSLVDRNAPNFEHVVRGHASLRTVVEILRKSATTNLKNVILCHLSPQNSDREEMLRQVREAAGVGVHVCVADSADDVSLLNVPFLGDF